jgi:hypothetical protein
MSLIKKDVFIDGNQEGFDLSLHMSSMVTATQVMSSKLSKQSAIMLTLSIGLNMGPKGSWIVDGAFGPNFS